MILNVIVDDYICLVEFVGFWSIFKRGDVGYSLVMICNEMVDFEDMGFLE